MTSCATANSELPAAVVAMPKFRLFQYSPAFQTRAADELQTMPSAPCARDVPTAPCSAVRRMIQDYGFDRDQMRTAGMKETP